MTDPDIIKECRQTGRTRTTTKNLLQKAYHKQMTKEIDISRVLIEGDYATIMGVKYRRIIEPKSPVEEAYKRWMGEYPPTTPSVSNYEDNRWSAFQNGYSALHPQEEPKKPQTLYDALDKLDRPMFVDDVYYVVKNWLPTKRVENKYDADYNSGWNDLLDTLRRTLR